MSGLIGHPGRANHKGAVSITGLFADLREALPHIANNQSDIILVDAALPGGLTAVGQVRGVAPQAPVIVIALAGAPAQIITWAEAGASGYIPRTAGLKDIVPHLVAILEGKQLCSASVAVGVLRRLFNRGTLNGGCQNAISPQTLSRREAQIAQMITAGMSNKDIARCLNIGLATTKTHVHHRLAKLNLQRRAEIARWTSGRCGGHLGSRNPLPLARLPEQFVRISSSTTRGSFFFLIDPFSIRGRISSNLQM